MTVAKTGKTGAGAKASSRPKTGAGGSARARKPTAKSVIAAARPAADDAAVPAATKVATLRKKELIERVAAVSGVKKQDTRAIIDAVLSVLGDALAAGETLALPPLGKARVNRHKDVDGGEILTVKLRRGGPATAKEPLAEQGE
jgi:nucleoid DNA-binding protein